MPRAQGIALEGVLDRHPRRGGLQTLGEARLCLPANDENDLPKATGGVLARIAAAFRNWRANRLLADEVELIKHAVHIECIVALTDASGRAEVPDS